MFVHSSIENPLHTKRTIPRGDHKLPAGGPGCQVLSEGQVAVHGSGWGPGTEKQHQVKPQHGCWAIMWCYIPKTHCRVPVVQMCWCLILDLFTVLYNSPLSVCILVYYKFNIHFPNFLIVLWMIAAFFQSHIQPLLSADKHTIQKSWLI